MGSFIDLTGHRFGRLIVNEASDERIKGNVMWRCTCDCGAAVLAKGAALRYREVRSCGCLAADMVRERNTTHGLSRHPAYRTWCSIHRRCLSDASRADDYFGRGIHVCERWASFSSFWEDMGETWRKDLTLERVDNDKGYEPENCVWADYRTQSNNTRRNRWIETPRGLMTVAQASREFGIRYPTLHHRVRLGLTGAALIAPIKNGGRDADEEAMIVRQIAELNHRLSVIRRKARPKAA